MYSARSDSLTRGEVRGCELSVDSKARWRKISVSMASSVESGSLKPSGPKSLMPLSCQGLWEAEMTMPAEKEWARARKATAGVVMTPADSTVAPAAVRPAVRRGGDPVGGFAGVLADEDAGRGAEVVGESEADGVDGGGVERGLAGDATNAVGSEELLHQMDLRVYYQGD